MTEQPDNWRKTCLHADALRVYGGLGVICGLVLLVLVFLNKHAAATGGHDLTWAIYPAGFFLITGTGLMFNLRIFAVVFSLAAGAAGLWLAIGGIILIHETPFMILNVLFGILLMLPAWSTFIGWRALR